MPAKFFKILTLASLGLLFDTWSTVTLSAGPITLSEFVNVVLYHAIASVFFAGCLFELTPSLFKGTPLMNLTTLFVLCFFLPGIGVLGLLVGLVVPLYYPKLPEEKYWEFIAEPELPQRATSTAAQVAFGVGGVPDVIKHSQDVEKRLSAVRSVRELPGKIAVPILQTALTDSTDDVRLLAYGMLDNRETRINERIAKNLERLSGSTRNEQSELHQLIASAYWELTYIGLAKGSVLDSVLNNAWQHAVEAIKIDDCPQMKFLLGRIAIMNGDHANAAYFLNAAEQGGIPPEEIYPYYAEAAYLRRDYDVAASYSRRMAESGKVMGKLGDATAIWQ